MRDIIDVYVSEIQNIFGIVKSKNRKYTHILIEFQDALKLVAFWNVNDKLDFFAKFPLSIQQNYKIDHLYSAFLDTIRMVWKEAYILDTQNKTKVEIEKNAKRLVELCSMYVDEVEHVETQEEIQESSNESNDDVEILEDDEDDEEIADQDQDEDEFEIAEEDEENDVETAKDDEDEDDVEFLENDVEIIEDDEECHKEDEDINDDSKNDRDNDDDEELQEDNKEDPIESHYSEAPDIKIVRIPSIPSELMKKKKKVKHMFVKPPTSTNSFF